jgi:selenide,water dikinase
LPEAAATTAIVTTADFITPPFDDPEGYGRIAAANALSDVYAMGGTPLCAINLCVFPRELEPAVAREILAGAAAVLAEVGAPLVGGHTVRGPELLFGLSVTGLVDRQRIWRNVGAQVGDQLVLTRPLGAGLVVTAARRGLIAEGDRRACAAQLAQPNRKSAEVLRRFAVHAATDITGFGLVGHALGMVSAVSIALSIGKLPVYGGARALAAAGITCGGAQANRSAYQPRLQLDTALGAAEAELLFDPQTSGGLLVALPAAETAAAITALAKAGVDAVAIGSVIAAAPTARLHIVD